MDQQSWHVSYVVAYVLEVVVTFRWCVGQLLAVQAAGRSWARAECTDRRNRQPHHI